MLFLDNFYKQMCETQFKKLISELFSTFHAIELWPVG
jgi:hypothetical protein